MNTQNNRKMSFNSLAQSGARIVGDIINSLGTPNKGVSRSSMAISPQPSRPTTPFAGYNANNQLGQMNNRNAQIAMPANIQPSQFIPLGGMVRCQSPGPLQSMYLPQQQSQQQQGDLNQGGQFTSGPMLVQSGPMMAGVNLNAQATQSVPQYSGGGGYTQGQSPSPSPSPSPAFLQAAFGIQPHDTSSYTNASRVPVQGLPFVGNNGNGGGNSMGAQSGGLGLLSGNSAFGGGAPGNSFAFGQSGNFGGQNGGYYNYGIQGGATGQSNQVGVSGQGSPVGFGMGYTTRQQDTDPASVLMKILGGNNGFGGQSGANQYGDPNSASTLQLLEAHEQQQRQQAKQLQQQQDQITQLITLLAGLQAVSGVSNQGCSDVLRGSAYNNPFSNTQGVQVGGFDNESMQYNSDAGGMVNGGMGGFRNSSTPMMNGHLINNPGNQGINMGNTGHTDMNTMDASAILASLNGGNRMLQSGNVNYIPETGINNNMMYGMNNQSNFGGNGTNRIDLNGSLLDALNQSLCLNNNINSGMNTRQNSGMGNATNGMNMNNINGMNNSNLLNGLNNYGNMNNGLNMSMNMNNGGVDNSVNSGLNAMNNSMNSGLNNSLNTTLNGSMMGLNNSQFQ